MKDMYNHVVYYLFFLSLFCVPALSSAQEAFPEEGQSAREQKAQEERPLGETLVPPAPPPPHERQPAISTFTGPETASSGHLAQADTPFEKGRLAILGMLGEYEVRFAFIETVVLQSGYERRSSKDSSAFEAVVLVEDSGRKIVLQHLLVSKDGKRVTKHWRQDWTFEAPTRFEFTEAQTWRLKAIHTEVTQAAWTQCVYEVNDAPRYCGTGKWHHRYGVATWTSDRTWRPLPRREYTVRSDYNTLNAENRHTIVPSGWTHEQDNTKTVREGEFTREILVREFGFNEYRRIAGFDFAPAYEYWNATKEYWSRVRREWDARLAGSKGLSLRTKVDGVALIEPMFEQAESVRAGQDVTDAEISALFGRWVTAPGAAGTIAVKLEGGQKSTY
jgi:hypothetical protein